MFAVKIYIDTDGDFGYEDPEFNVENDKEKIFYFESRKDAADALIRSFHNLKNSLRPCGRYHIKRWIDSMDSRIELIVRKFPTFIIEEDFGNQYLFYSLCKVDKKELSNGSICYELLDVDINFSWYEEEMVKWDEVTNSPDVE